MVDMQFDLKEFRIDAEVARIANAHYFEFVNNYHTVADRHGFHELVYVDSGHINVKAENYTGVLQAEQMIIHEPGELHELSCDEDEAPNVIIIGFECRCDKLGLFSRRPVILNAQSQRLLAETVKECRNLFLPPYDVPRMFDMKKRENRIFGCDQMVKILLEQFLIKLIRFAESGDSKTEARQTDGAVTEICAYLNANFKQELSIKRLCILFGTNKTTLSMRFKQQIGKTIVEYVNSLKIIEAKRLIRLGGKTFSEIAEELGFSSQHYFTKLFTKVEKQSPSLYMHMIKSKLDGGNSEQ
ncbi:hypothetical protein FACS1894211_15720 [Clostridia bacterium]|nr:hypothetical protein FACS1894211_15720 [Clostridia bacterium]